MKEKIWSNKAVNVRFIDNEYYMTTVFYVDKCFEAAFLDLSNKKTTMGVVFGEFGDDIDYDISLTRVSHILDSITIKPLSIFIKVTVIVKTLNTSIGQELKSLIRGNIPMVGRLRYVDISRIITVDIDLLQNVVKKSDQLRIERRLKMEQLKNNTTNA